MTLIARLPKSSGKQIKGCSLST